MLRNILSFFVIPAKAGIQEQSKASSKLWIPAFAGMTLHGKIAFLFFSSIFFTNNAFAAPASLPALAMSASSQIGVVAAVQGAVKISSQGQVGRVVSSGEPIYLGDQVSTDEKSTLQILLLDQTTFTIGPNSAIVIDKFIYDPATHEGEVKAKVVKGVFRFVTGKIAQKKPSQMEVELPAGTIGIRGTIVAGECAGKRSTVVLLGPGENNNTPHKVGQFTLQNQGRQSLVSKSGFGATIDGEASQPTPAFKVPEVDLQRLATALGPLPGAEEKTSPASQGNSQANNQPDNADPNQPPREGDKRNEKVQSPTEQAGQGRASAQSSVRLGGLIGNLINNITRESTQASQESISNTVAAILDGPTTRNQLQLFAQQFGGAHRFQKLGIPLSTGGSANVLLDINFGAREVGGGQSRITGTLGLVNGDDFIFPISTGHNFGGGDLPAVFNFLGLVNSVASSPCASGDCAKANLEVHVQNAGGIIAGQAQLTLLLKNSDGEPKYQASAVAPRVAGETPGS